MNESLSQMCRVSNGARTRDHWNHNPVLYQLSYTHRPETPSLGASFLAVNERVCPICGNQPEQRKLVSFLL